MEAAGDLVKADLLGEGAVVPDVDVEGFCAAFDQSIVDWGCCCRQGEQRGENPALSVHFDCSVCGGVSEVLLLYRMCVWKPIQYACIEMVVISRDIKFWLCPLSGDKDISTAVTMRQSRQLFFYSR